MDPVEGHTDLPIMRSFCALGTNTHTKVSFLHCVFCPSRPAKNKWKQNVITRSAARDEPILCHVGVGF
jgi:hypothetical protein